MLGRRNKKNTIGKVNSIKMSNGLGKIWQIGEDEVRPLYPNQIIRVSKPCVIWNCTDMYVCLFRDLAGEGKEAFCPFIPDNIYVGMERNWSYLCLKKKKGRKKKCTYHSVDNGLEREHNDCSKLALEVTVSSRKTWW